MKTRLFTLLLLLALLSGAAITQAQATNLTATAGCIETFDASVDYFPDKVTVEYAAGFSVEYFDSYKVVTVNTPWQGAEAPLRYVLVQCGAPAPTGFEDAALITVPVTRFVGMSTSFLPHIVGQGLLDRLIGVDTTLYTSSEDVLKKAADGELAEVGGGGAGGDPNIEVLLDLEPDLVMTQRFSGADTGYPMLLDAGLPVVINADFLDTSPLGQAEWGKFIALFFNTEKVAQETFAGVAERYEALKALAAEQTEKPTVFANTPFGDTWYMPGGQSYLGQLLADAGAVYLWGEDESTGSLFLDLETVFETAADADVWVNVFVMTAADLVAQDARFADFAAYKNGQVYTNNARSNANGGSEYFETGVANPDVILADLVKIFHPDLLPDHELYYYAALTR